MLQTIQQRGTPLQDIANNAIRDHVKRKPNANITLQKFRIN